MMSGDWRVKLLFTGYDSEKYRWIRASKYAQTINARTNAAAEATRAVSYLYIASMLVCVTSPGIEDLEARRGCCFAWPGRPQVMQIGDLDCSFTFIYVGT